MEERRLLDFLQKLHNSQSLRMRAAQNLSFLVLFHVDMIKIGKGTWEGIL